MTNKHAHLIPLPSSAKQGPIYGGASLWGIFHWCQWRLLSIAWHLVEQYPRVFPREIHSKFQARNRTFPQEKFLQPRTDNTMITFFNESAQELIGYQRAHEPPGGTKEE